MYCHIDFQKDLSVDTAKLFKNGQSQAVRLPKQYAFHGTEVFVKRIGGVVMLIPKNSDPWKPFVDSLDKFSEDFMSSRPAQGTAEARE
jgi:antitoxin VapB